MTNEQEQRQILTHALFERGRAFPVKYIDTEAGMQSIVFGSYLKMSPHAIDDQHMPWQLLLRPDYYERELRELADRMSRERKPLEEWMALASAFIHDDPKAYLSTRYPNTLRMDFHRQHEEALFLSVILWTLKDALPIRSSLESLAALAAEVQGLGMDTRQRIAPLEAKEPPSPEFLALLRQGDCRAICKAAGFSPELSDQIAALNHLYGSSSLSAQAAHDWLEGTRILAEAGKTPPPFEHAEDAALYATYLGRESRIRDTIERHTAEIHRTIDRFYGGDALAFTAEAIQLGQEMAEDFLYLPSYALEDMLETGTYVTKRFFPASEMRRSAFGATTSYREDLTEVYYTNDHVSLKKRGELTALAHEYMGHVMQRVTAVSYMSDMPESLLAAIEEAAHEVSASVERVEKLYCPEPYTFETWKESTRKRFKDFVDLAARCEKNIAECREEIIRIEGYLAQDIKMRDEEQDKIAALEAKPSLSEWEENTLSHLRQSLQSHEEFIQRKKDKIDNILGETIPFYQKMIDDHYQGHIIPGRKQLEYIDRLEAIADAQLPPNLQGEDRTAALNEACHAFHLMFQRMNSALFTVGHFFNAEGAATYNVADKNSRWFTEEQDAPGTNKDMAAAEILCNVIGVLIDPQHMGPPAELGGAWNGHPPAHVAMMRDVLAPMIDVIERPGGYIDLCRERAGDARRVREEEERLLQPLEAFSSRSAEQVLEAAAPAAMARNAGSGRSA